MFGRVKWILVPLLAALPVFAQQGNAPAPASVPASTLITPQIVANPEVKLVDQEGAGKLYRVGDQRVCVLEGTPPEMGFQHGRLLAQIIHESIKGGYMKKALYDMGYTREYIDAQSKVMEKHIPPEYIEEMRGIVAGLKKAGVNDITYEEILSSVTQAEIKHHKPNQPPDLSKPVVRQISGSCSNFAVWGEWTNGGRLLHGRNLDWTIDTDAQNGAVIFVWRPKGGTPYMMLGFAGTIGSVTGMNAQGITFGEMTSISTQETFDGIPLLVLMRRVLEKASTLDEAVAILKEGPRTTGWNFILGDGKVPDGRALEVDAVDCEVFTTEDPKESEETGHWAMVDAVRRTNHPIGLKQIQKLMAAFGPQLGIAPENWKNVLPILQMQNTWQRYDGIGKQIQAQPGKFDVSDALRILANPPVGGEKTATLHSCVFDPKNRTAYVSVAGNNPPVPAPLRPYTKIDLTEWFK